MICQSILIFLAADADRFFNFLSPLINYALADDFCNHLLFLDWTASNCLKQVIECQCLCHKTSRLHSLLSVSFLVYYLLGGSSSARPTAPPCSDVSLSRRLLTFCGNSEIRDREISLWKSDLGSLTSDLRLPTSDLRLLTSALRLLPSALRLPTSDLPSSFRGHRSGPVCI